MKKSTEEKIESAKAKLNSNKSELKKLRQRTFIYFVSEYKRKYPQGVECANYTYDELLYDKVDKQQRQNTERITCLLDSMNNLRRDIKKWRGWYEN